MLSVLIVEDEDMIRQKIRYNIDWSQNGFGPIYEASNGLEGLDVLSKHAIDLVITDIEMPGMSGIELVKRIKQIHSQTRVIIITGHAEFEYAVESIKLNVSDYLLKPFQSRSLLSLILSVKEEVLKGAQQATEIERMRSQLLENRRSLQDKLFQELLGNTFVGSIEESLDFLGLSRLNHLSVQVCTIQIEDYPAEAELTAEEQRYVVHYSMLDWIRELAASRLWLRQLYADREAECRIISSRMHQIVLIGLSNGEDSAAMAMLEELVERANIELGVVLTVGLGQQYQAMRDMCVSYREAVSAVALGSIHGKGVVYTFGEVHAEERHHSKLLQMLVDHRLFSELKSGDLRMIHQHITAIFAELRQSGVTREAFLAVVNNVILLSYKSLNEAGHKLEGMVIENFSKMISETDDMGQIERKLMCFYENLLTQIKSKKRNRNENLVLELKNYLDTHFNENITLTSLSKQLSISSGYLSILFRDYTSSNFSEYLTELRISKAKELLTNTDLRIYEIAEKIGYRDAFYFSAAFKKEVGVNPSDYREQIGRS